MATDKMIFATVEKCPSEAEKSYSPPQHWGGGHYFEISNLFYNSFLRGGHQSYNYCKYDTTL